MPYSSWSPEPLRQLTAPHELFSSCSTKKQQLFALPVPTECPHPFCYFLLPRKKSVKICAKLWILSVQEAHKLLVSCAEDTGFIPEEHVDSPASGAVSKTTWNRGVFDMPSAITWKGGVAFSGYTRAIIWLSVSFCLVYLISFEIFGCSLQNLCSDTSTFCLHSPPNISHIQPSSLLGCSKTLFMECSPQQLSLINYPCWVLLNSLAITTFGKHPEIVPWLERIQLSIFSAEFASSVCTPCSVPATARTRAARSAQAATELFHTSYQPLILIICNHAQFAALLNSLPRD